ncbi:hypothetical protein OAM12_00070 [Candidatus Pelagibacter sp.]|nr:hypothetical protein [Candidatus Pelagibacter sp.]
MSNYTEADLIPFALQILNENPGGVDTSKLIENLRQKMQPSEHDLEILSNRNDDKFSQKVRNLKSHKTLENKNLAVFKDDKFFITEEGKKYLIKDDNQAEDINILENWELTTKTFNALRDQGIIYLSDLKEWPDKKLLTIPGFGKRGVEEIKSYLNKYNLATINTNQTKTISKQEIPNIETESDAKTIELLNTNILREWPLSVRTFNALKSENITFLGDLLSQDISDLLKLKNFGRKSLNEIKEFLERENVNHNLMVPVRWQIIRDELILKEKQKKLLNLKTQNSLRGIKKTLFKDFDKFKDRYLKEEKVLIKKDINNFELENLIIGDINNILSLLTEKMSFIFMGRYGYTQSFKTLENLGKKFNVTRERIRQYEREINKTLIKIGKIDKYSLIEYFKQYSSISFHKLFPQLSKNFTDTSHSNGGGDITRDRLVVFIENFCGVEVNFFTTPERELWHFDSEKLKEIFIFTPSGITTNNFIEIIKDNYGYDEFTSKLALEFMNKREFIKIVNEKIYPVKINKNEEVAHILLDYPDGLHWRKICEIGNKSYTNNKWDLDRIVGDSSLSMTSNPHIYLKDKGKHKLIKYLILEVDNKDELISLTIDLLNKLNLKQSDLEKIFKEIIQIEKYNDLDFYDFRAIIKIFGEEKNLYHSGKSGQNTISFNKSIKPISLKDKIREIIENSDEEISQQEINKKLQKSNERLALSVHLDALEKENLIFKINPGIYLNYENAINLCDKKEVEIFLNSLIEKFEFITSGYMREKINEIFGYKLSNSYYSSLSKILAKENNWYYGYNYLSKKNAKTINTDQYVKEAIDLNLSNNENFEIISKKIGISKQYFFNIIYSIKDNFNTDWVHQND